MSGPVELYLILLASGLVLLAFELFLPGGVIGTFGGMAILAAIITGFVAFGAQGGFVSAVCIIVFGSLVLMLWLKMFPRTGVGRRLSLETDGRDFKSAPSDWQAYAGKEGVAQSELRPAGMAMIDGQRVDVVADSGGFIKKGARVRVVSVEGYRIIVQQVAAP